MRRTGQLTGNDIKIVYLITNFLKIYIEFETVFDTILKRIEKEETYDKTHSMGRTAFTRRIRYS